MKNSSLLTPSRLREVLFLLLLSPFLINAAISNSNHPYPPYFKSQRLYLRGPPLPRLVKPHPQLMLEEIDPRYGVAKRLVPSGPNPLHNWIIKPLQLRTTCKIKHYL
ncbi:hypothetical protein HanIR_Chr17g0902391 [Helianthus annuus]|nr:hypothetical protein HanIR_Chr17g0902391 [Helianthus annuus]